MRRTILLLAMLAVMALMLAIGAGTAVAQGQAFCGIGAVESSLATTGGVVLGEGTRRGHL
jgi:hypothetical protein